MPSDVGGSTSATAWASVLRGVRFPAPQAFTYLDAAAATGTAEDVALASLESSDAQFFRFSQSAQETYKAEAGLADNDPNAVSPANTHLFRRGMRTLTAGGMFGMGPGAGTRKFGLPEPHTDYIFSVIGEEFGLIACLAIAILYLTIVARVLIKLLDEDNSFALLAAAGLVIEFGLQALINMMVNVQLAPSKGMTLPFISYGGSSMLALSIAMGLLLAFTRRNPYLTRSPYVVKWSGESLTA
jgi:hypothetical protein